MSSYFRQSRRRGTNLALHSCVEMLCPDVQKQAAVARVRVYWSLSLASLLLWRAGDALALPRVLGDGGEQGRKIGSRWWGSRQT